MSAAETKKYRVTKKWPGGPEVGTVGDERSCYGVSVYFNEGSGSFYKTEELQGFVEEVKPEEFWCIDCAGNILGSKTFTWLVSSVPYLRFKTKEACEKFRDSLISTHGNAVSVGSGTSLSVIGIVSALNQRVTK